MFHSRRPFALLTALVALTTFANTVHAEPARRIAVVPFAALSGDLPTRAGAKAAGMLSTEIKNTQGVELVASTKAAAADPAQDGLARARTLLDEAKTQRSAKKFRLAEETVQKALAEFREAAGAVESTEEVADAYALQSAILYVTGRDEQGQASLDQALVLAGTSELALQKSSPLFSKVVEDRRKALAAAPKGSLLVDSSPPGAAVFVDGMSVGSAPVSLKAVPPGLHLWRVRLPSGELVGGSVEVAAGKEAKVAGQVVATDPESRIVAALAQNTFDQAAVTAAQEHAKALNADLLILGALSREGKGLALDGFVFAAEQGELKRLPRKTFDTELLSAGMEFFNLAGDLAKSGAALGEQAKVPATIAAGRGSQPKVTEAVYGAVAQKAATEDDTQPAGGQKADEKREPLKTRKPLIRNK